MENYIQTSSGSYPDQAWRDEVGKLDRYYIYDIVSVSLRFSPGFFTKCIGYDTNCNGAVTQSIQVGTDTHRSATITFRIETLA